MENITDSSLKDILKNISKTNSENYEQCWRDFTKQYKNFIYQVVTRRVLSWNVPRLRNQLSDVVNDIVAEVFIILIKSISTYRELDNEKKFLFWLSYRLQSCCFTFFKKAIYFNNDRSGY